MAVGDRSGHGYASYLVFGPPFRLSRVRAELIGLPDLKSRRVGFQIRPCFGPPLAPLGAGRTSQSRVKLTAWRSSRRPAPAPQRCRRRSAPRWGRK